jgi:hydrogenase-4 component B
LINLFIIIVLLAVIIITFAGEKIKGLISLAAIITLGLFSGYFGIRALTGSNLEVLMEGTALFGRVPVRIDSLSGWFLLVIDFTFITGSLYGYQYMKRYSGRKSELTLHNIALVTAHAALIGICSVQNGFIFLLLWEIMALSVFILVIFEHEKSDTIKAGINYLVQSHISIVFVLLGFIYTGYKTGNFGFDAIAEFSKHQSTLEGTFLFLIFFIGFAIKAGFVPFHTWLPYAHPAAPTHVSGIMSGVVIKIGIYGILRMLLLIKTDYTTIGYVILFISVISGLYGVMLATVQHNLKKLLAYHSIENIGIIGIGIGLGCIGLGTTNKWMALLGFSGALLHTLNHSLFKSLLFYSSGNVLQATGTMNIEKLGGLIKKMPWTGVMFLIAAIAICGLPPLNGFISEFLIYGGLYNWLFSSDLLSLITIIFSVLGLVLIGGLAILCFTKAFSVVFLGTARSDNNQEISERNKWQLLPMILTGTLMISIGIFPTFYLRAMTGPVNLFTHNTVFNLNLLQVSAIDSLKVINWLAIIFILFVTLLVLFRKKLISGRKIEINSTWGCGYATGGSKLQYTAGSFVRSYSKLAKPILDIEKRDVEINEVFPGKKEFVSEPYDKIERVFIDKPLKVAARLSDTFTFLQNGRLQFYILYGIIFIMGIICLPLIFEKIIMIIHFLNNL